MDGAIGSLHVLPEIAVAVGSEMTVIFDSGVRTGADIVKALCLGAEAVMIGRPVIYGLGIGGKYGAMHVLKSILADLWRNMALSGLETVAHCEQGVLRRINESGEDKPVL